MQKTIEIPRGVGAPPPPGMDLRKGKGKLMCIKVRMLDNSIAVFHLGHKANGQALFNEVCRYLNLLESDYFGLEYLDGYGNKCWLEKDKSILRQITSSQSDAKFYFVCKFYSPNPADLEEEYTRYLLSLQIRRDLAQGELLCNENTAALLASFIVQAECGDFSVEDYPDSSYLSSTNFIPNQTIVFQNKIMENHKKLIGMTPAESDLALLETARRCDFYGIKLHSAKDIEGTEVALAVIHLGIKVFHQLNCISTFSWAKIRKLSFKRKHLMIKLHTESYQYYKETIEFNFENRNECKNFWKKCVEHHSFFRCLETASFFFLLSQQSGEPFKSNLLHNSQKKDTKKLFSHGSSFRYQGRTQKQLIDFVREQKKRREFFQRPMRLSNKKTNNVYYSTTPHNNNVNSYNDANCKNYASNAYLKNVCNCEKRQQNQIIPNHEHQNQTIQYYYPVQTISDLDSKCPEIYYPVDYKTCQQQNYINFYPNNHNFYTNKQCQIHGTPSYNHQIQENDQKQKNLYNCQQRPKSVFVSSKNPNEAHNFSNVPKKNYNSTADVTLNSSNQFPKDVTDYKMSNNVTYRCQNQTTDETEEKIKQPVDLMSTSMPNVLSDDLKVLCQEYCNKKNHSARTNTGNHFNNPPPKSISGDNFINQSEKTNSHNKLNSAVLFDVSELLYDNMSEGSYRLVDNNSSIKLEPNSYTLSQSNLGPLSDSSRVLSTTFTTQRVGNVIVKNVIDQKDRKNYKKKKSMEDDDESLSSYAESFCKTSCVSAPPSSSNIINQSAHLRQRLQNAVPIQIDTPPNGGHALYKPSPPRINIQNTKNNTKFYSLTEELNNNLHLSKSQNITESNAKPINVKGILRTTNDSLTKNAENSTSSEIIRPILITDSLSDINSPNSRYNTTKNCNLVLLRSRPMVVTPLSNQNKNNIALNSNKDLTALKKPIVFGAKCSEINIIKNNNNCINTNNTINLAKETEQQHEKLTQQPLKGRIISKHNMVITPDGILPFEEILNQQKKEKPVVPPKPKILLKDFKATIEQDVYKNEISNEQKIVNNDFSKKLENTSDIFVSIQSEDNPEVKKLHIFGQIPYTLTMRNLQEGKCIEPSNEKNLGGISDLQKKINLVNRKQLPSQSSFSSQDHSISPTSLESGNIVEYVMKKRSISSDRCLLNENKPNFSNSKDKRRQTQPISVLTFSIDNVNNNNLQNNQNFDKEKDKKQDLILKEDNDLVDLPEPPKFAVNNDKTMIESNINDETQNSIKKLLETDF